MLRHEFLIVIHKFRFVCFSSTYGTNITKGVLRFFPVVFFEFAAAEEPPRSLAVVVVTPVAVVKQFVCSQFVSYK